MEERCQLSTRFDDPFSPSTLELPTPLSHLHLNDSPLPSHPPPLRPQDLNPNKRFLVTSLSTHPGSGTLGGHFGGQYPADFVAQRKSLVQMLEMGLYGVPLVGVPVCGSTNGSSDLRTEWCLRSHQSAAFWPLMVSHYEEGQTPRNPPNFEIIPPPSPSFAIFGTRFPLPLLSPHPLSIIIFSLLSYSSPLPYPSPAVICPSSYVGDTAHPFLPFPFPPPLLPPYPTPHPPPPSLFLPFLSTDPYPHLFPLPSPPPLSSPVSSPPPPSPPPPYLSLPNKHLAFPPSNPLLLPSLHPPTLPCPLPIFPSLHPRELVFLPPIHPYSPSFQPLPPAPPSSPSPPPGASFFLLPSTPILPSPTPLYFLPCPNHSSSSPHPLSHPVPSPPLPLPLSPYPPLTSHPLPSLPSLSPCHQPHPSSLFSQSLILPCPQYPLFPSLPSLSSPFPIPTPLSLPPSPSLLNKHLVLLYFRIRSRSESTRGCY
ncbi:hypothetical protein C7M84_024567 [Penaeus vannamei]|uniref:Glycoside hydrolase family 31 TIM barrel domain-containing protein n=1 Tax=Penaeus vannamei TaxID=6689 RepID=A0A423U0Q4_PENVA|nr:hypothetical protein C7M84_024567 [Penaeus vannamei]